MTRARSNRTDADRGTRQYLDWHWFKPGEKGAPEVKVVTWKDPDVPASLIECGRLVRFHVRLPSHDSPKHPRRDRDTMIEFSRAVSDKSHLAFDPDHTRERLYCLIDASARPALKERFWSKNPISAMDLNDLAQFAGGKHGRDGDYPGVNVKPVGVVTAVCYRTTKKEDGDSYYIHKMGELTHHYPILACDFLGRLWLAGGSYTCPRPGITN